MRRPPANLILYLLICFVCFLGTFGFYLDFYIKNLIPFGRGDVDNYMCMIGHDLSYRVLCPQGPDFVHFGFVFTIRGISFISGLDPGVIITLFIPFCLWIITPVILLLFSFSILEDLDLSIWASLFCLFGSSILFYFGVVALYSQFFGFMLFLAAITIKKVLMGYKPLTLVIMALSIVFYPYIIAIYGAIYISENWRRFRIINISIIILVCLGFSLMPGAEFWRFTRYNGYNYSQPDLYTILSILVNPVLFFLFLYGIKSKELDLIYPFLIASFFSDLGRLLIMFIPFLYVYAARGLNVFLEGSENKEFIRLMFWIYLFLFFNYLIGYYYWPTLDQMHCIGSNLCRNIR